MAKCFSASVFRALSRQAIVPAALSFLISCGGSRPDSSNAPAPVANPDTNSEGALSQPSTPTAPGVVIVLDPASTGLTPATVPNDPSTSATAPAVGTEPLPPVTAPTVGAEPLPPVTAPVVSAPVIADWATINEKVIKANCIRCHTANNEDYNFETYAGVKALAPQILDAVFVRASMPPRNRKIPDDQKALLKAWLDAGAPETVSP